MNDEEIKEIRKLAGIKDPVMEGVFSHRPNDSLELLVKDIEMSAKELVSNNPTLAEIDARDVKAMLDAIVKRMKGIG